MKMTLELYGTRYSAEHESDAYRADELKDLFSRLLVVAQFPPSVIQADEDGGKYMYVGENEVVISKEELEELKGKRKQYE